MLKCTCDANLIFNAIVQLWDKCTFLIKEKMYAPFLYTYTVMAVSESLRRGMELAFFGAPASLGALFVLNAEK